MRIQNEHQYPPHLLSAANRQLDWRWEDTPIAGETWPVAVAADPDGMLIEACERQDAGEEGVIDPFWATTWRAASGLDRFLERFELDGKRVLELGCGTGHAGIAAALRGAKVVLTDGVEDPLHLARLSTHPLADQCEIRRLRFGIDKLPEKFALILGSDVTYLRDLWPKLILTFEQHLEPAGKVLLSDPNRIIADEFREWIRSKPWDYEEYQVPMDDNPEQPIRIMQLRRKDP